MEEPRMRLGIDDSWLELAWTGENSWQVTARWCSMLKADFTAYLTEAEVVDFAERCFRTWTERRVRASRRR
jgi:hypothetical protein